MIVFLGALLGFCGAIWLASGPCQHCETRAWIRANYCPSCGRPPFASSGPT